ncbi:MAG: efflux RND transporter permease subunit [Agitococcus sp.]|nr:efflux RND transporter permease subunit [Agitococcus sp.]
MSFSAWFIHRPVATLLLTLALALSGVVAFQYLPVATLPQVDYPSIGVNATLPGASPETVAATLATPLERTLGRIAGVTEITSTSTQGLTRINMQFDLDRDTDGAARDVQAALNAARSQLPEGLPINPSYRKANGGTGTIISIALTSPTHTQAQLYDIAFTIFSQNISQVAGVAQVSVNGSALRSVRVEVNPTLLNQYAISLEQVRTAIAAANGQRPTGVIENAAQQWQISINDKARQARDYQSLIVSWRNNAPIRLSDIATVRDSVQELRNAGSSNGKPAVLLGVMNQTGANVVTTVDAIKALLPRLQTLIPADINVDVVIDRSTTIRKSLREIEHTLLIAIGLVVLVTFVFLRSARATLIPSIAIPVSLLATLTVIYFCGFSINNLSLMALIIAASFVVDDAIVVVENISHHLERGLSPLAAALQGVKEVGFTVLAMSLSLVAVFVPLLFMGGIIGRLFREFAVTLSVAVIVSLIVSLTLIPMLSAKLLKPIAKSKNDVSFSVRVGQSVLSGYSRSLTWALAHSRFMLLLLASTIALNVYLYTVIPKGFFPQQDTGRLQGFFQADQSTSFQTMRQKINQLMAIVSKDPDIDTYYEYTGGSGGGQSNTGTMFGRLKPRAEREATAAEIVDRLRPKLAKVAGATLILTAQQELNIGVRQGGAQFQYTLLANDLEELRRLAPRLRGALSRLPELTDVNSDFQDKGLQTFVHVDREAAARLGISPRQIDNALNNAFGQRLVSTIYEPLNQYYVVLTLEPQFTQSPAALNQIYLTTNQGAKIPLTAISRIENKSAPLAINHDGGLIAATISFNLAPNVALEQATVAVEQAFAKLNPPDTIQSRFSGAAKVFKDSLASQPMLILAALLTVYIVLGVLYESLIHPLTIISTLPSAGVGALLALLAFKSEFSIIAMIGILLLIGIVMKNAIMLIDSALQAEREQGLTPAQAIHHACLLRFRPILMTTLAAMFGALPLALGAGDGSEIRRPLGIAIVGGLFVSQILTLYTTPVIYLYLDRFRLWALRLGKSPLNAQLTLSSIEK